MRLSPRDFFDRLVSSADFVKASACWPWLFQGAQCSLGSEGVRFVAVNADLEKGPFSQVELERAGYWVRSVDNCSVLLGSKTNESKDDRMPLPVAAGLSFLLASQGWLVAHAALLRPERSTRAILITGESGAGKSTFCLSALRSGWSVYSDDFVAICSDGVKIFGFGLRDFMRIRGSKGPVLVPIEAHDGPVEIGEIWGLSPAVSRPPTTSLTPMPSHDTARRVCDALSFGFLLLGGRMPTAIRAQLLSLPGRKLVSGFDLVAERSRVLESECIRHLLI